MREAVAVAGSRTGLAKSFRGFFNMTLPYDLAAHCVSHVLGKTPQLDPGSRKGTGRLGIPTRWSSAASPLPDPNLTKWESAPRVRGSQLLDRRGLKVEDLM